MPAPGRAQRVGAIIERHHLDPAERAELTEQDLAVATLVGRYIERRETGQPPCAHELLAAATEFGDTPVDVLRTILARYEAMRASDDLAPLTENDPPLIEEVSHAVTDRTDAGTLEPVAMSAPDTSPTITEVLRFEDLPLGSRGTRRAIARWSDGTESEALTYYADETLICEGDHGNSRLMSPRAEMHRGAGSVRVARGT